MREDDGQEATAYRMQVLLERLVLSQSSTGVTAEIIEELEAICKKLKAVPPLGVWDPFTMQLMARQGNDAPDFELLYKAKSKLDRILSKQPNDPRP
jgi:hypothetical protein